MPEVDNFMGHFYKQMSFWAV